MRHSIDVAERLEVLEEAIGLNSSFVVGINLTPSETAITGLLLKRDIVNIGVLHAALYGGRPECDQADPKTIDVMLCKLRKKLKPHGASIKNRWSIGWYMDSESKEKLRSLTVPSLHTESANDRSEHRT